MSDEITTPITIVENIITAPISLSPRGADGADGAIGPAGPAGPDGAPGVDGADGADGQGVPIGGTTGQVLSKASAADFDTQWVTGGGGGDLSAADIDELAKLNAIVGDATLGDASDFAPALGPDDNYVTDAEKAVIGNTSGTNSGDQDLSSYALSSSLGSIHTFEGNQNLRTTDPATFASLTTTGTVTASDGGGFSWPTHTSDGLRWATGPQLYLNGTSRFGISSVTGNPTTTRTIDCVDIDASGTVTGAEFRGEGGVWVNAPGATNKAGMVWDTPSFGLKFLFGGLNYFSASSPGVKIPNNRAYLFSPDTNVFGNADLSLSRFSAGTLALGTGALASTDGSLNLNNLTASGSVKTGSYTVATLPTVGTAQLIFVTDEAGGAIHCFSDGTNWRRLSDRAIVS